MFSKAVTMYAISSCIFSGVESAISMENDVCFVVRNKDQTDKSAFICNAYKAEVNSQFVNENLSLVK